MITFVVTFTLIAWSLYAVIMWLKRYKPYINSKWYLKYPVIIFAYFALLVDVYYNLTAGSILFLQAPKEFLFTTRLQRNLLDLGWRGTLAHKLCNLLDRSEPDHCKRK